MTMTQPRHKRGDVVLVLFPHSDLRTAKPRPALVVQADDLQTEIAQVIQAAFSFVFQQPKVSWSSVASRWTHPLPVHCIDWLYHHDSQLP